MWKSLLNSRLLFPLGIRDSIFQLSSICCGYRQFFQGNHYFIPSHAIRTAQNAMSNKRTYVYFFTQRLVEMIHIMICVQWWVFFMLVLFMSWNKIHKDGVAGSSTKPRCVSKILFTTGTSSGIFEYGHVLSGCIKFD